MAISKKVSIDVREKEDFFAKGKKIASLADKREKIPEEKTIWFEDVKDFNKFISAKKIALLAQIRDMPGSITELAKRINRDRVAVTRDVNELESSGLVKTEMISNHGHGRIRVVKPIAKHLLLQVKI